MEPTLDSFRLIFEDLRKLGNRLTVEVLAARKNAIALNIDKLFAISHEAEQKAESAIGEMTFKDPSTVFVIHAAIDKCLEAKKAVVAWKKVYDLMEKAVENRINLWSMILRGIEEGSIKPS